MNIAVVDGGNNLVAFVRMDGAWLGSIDIAQNKAYTARAFDMATKELAPLAQPAAPLYGIEAGNQGRPIVFAGGIPLKLGGRVVGRSASAEAALEDHDQARLADARLTAHQHHGGIAG